MSKYKLGKGRTEQAYNSKDKGGFSRQGIFDLSKIKDVKWFKAEKGNTYQIDMVPYLVKTDKHPLVFAKDDCVSIGGIDYVLDIYVHKNVGPNKADIVCPNRNYGKPCPICDEVKKLYDMDKADEAKSLTAKRRVIYNIQLVEKGEPTGELLLLEASHWKFEKILQAKANRCKNGEDVKEYGNPAGGWSVEFDGVKGTFSGREFVALDEFGFVERKYSIDDALIESAISLDALLIIKTAAEIEKLFWGDGDEDEDGAVQKEEVPATDPDEEEEAEEEVVEEKAAPPKKSETKTSTKQSSPSDDSITECPYGHELGGKDDFAERKHCSLCKRDNQKTHEACEELWMENQ